MEKNMRRLTVTIAKDASESSAVQVPVGETVIGAIAPAVEATTAQLSFETSNLFDGTYLPVYKNGIKLTLAITNGHDDRLDDIFSLYGDRFVKVIAETSTGTVVVQATAARTVTLLTETL